MTKTQYITKILKLNPDYVVGRLFEQPLSELKKIYRELNGGVDPSEIKVSCKRKCYPKKQVDDMGRIAIPKRFRKELDIKLGDTVEVKKYDDKIIIRKVKDE